MQEPRSCRQGTALSQFRHTHAFNFCSPVNRDPFVETFMFLRARLDVN